MKRWGLLIGAVILLGVGYGVWFYRTHQKIVPADCVVGVEPGLPRFCYSPGPGGWVKKQELKLFSQSNE